MKNPFCLENIQTSKIEELEKEIDLLKAKYDFSYLIDENDELRESMKNMKLLHETQEKENSLRVDLIEKSY